MEIANGLTVYISDVHLLSTSSSLFRRLAEALTRVPGPLDPSFSDGDELLDFQDFTKEEIEQIREVRHFSGSDRAQQSRKQIAV